MSDYEGKSPLYREYDLEQARRVPAPREPAPHQMRTGKPDPVVRVRL